LMSRTVQEAFYADMELIFMREGTFEQMIEKARSQSVRYIIVDEKIKEIIPDFLVKADQRGLKLLNSWEGKKRKISLFEILSRAG